MSGLKNSSSGMSDPAQTPDQSDPSLRQVSSGIQMQGGMRDLAAESVTEAEVRDFSSSKEGQRKWSMASTLLFGISVGFLPDILQAKEPNWDHIISALLCMFGSMICYISSVQAAKRSGDAIEQVFPRLVPERTMGEEVGRRAKTVFLGLGDILVAIVERTRQKLEK